ncbi:hypothetical protein EOW65_16060 [Sinirhodobacter ferrireducens]|uniref:Uncharacterized protein n=1 Tax=Paenirhodobacter ferrireducens TaxID=1215032 RepID=A0A443L9D0_9RHOB|nr:hypothetical protein [Sinirhodobacter ferrireducens]RWR45749.1 hypothetical protein EOW65_16060 [Sinirhodobacter ferrireducens]
MATFLANTPSPATEACDRFSHSLISLAFTQLNAAVALYIECERDLEHADCFDPAFLSWSADAEEARARVLGLAATITAQPMMRASDKPLKRSAMLTRLLIESDSAATFTSLLRLPGSHAELFACCDAGAVGARVRQMLETHQVQLEALADLDEFDDVGTHWPDAPAAEMPEPLTVACAL